MYESPIELTCSEIYSQIVKEQEDEILQAVIKTGVNVNKEELVKALSYDRNQYSKGFKDGVVELAKRLKERKYQSSEWSHGGHPFVVEEDDIDDISEELVGEDK